MRALPFPVLLLFLLAAGAWASISIPSPKQQPQPQPPVPPEVSPRLGPDNATQLEGEGAVGGSANRSETLVTRISSLLRDLPTLKAAVIVACAFTSFLIACLLLRVFRSGKRIKKTRKYDIITTPAERVEMTPLNEEDEDEEDSTVFDVKYRYIYR
ncbi:membrane protein FAM174B isoform X1 [Gracilinanus agilis]|uniref:membrane protein FAM174B isoform X1 n=2 Tax=Gracilinanus agilis TaxID=191870 RepID=UPI001CFEC22E|nr:membrane protein FAM174B isoform X1 [Gracilinanus agilis]